MTFVATSAYISEHGRPVEGPSLDIVLFYNTRVAREGSMMPEKEEFMKKANREKYLGCSIDWFQAHINPRSSSTCLKGRPKSM